MDLLTWNIWEWIIISTKKLDTNKDLSDKICPHGFISSSLGNFLLSSPTWFMHLRVESIPEIWINDFIDMKTVETSFMMMNQAILMMPKAKVIDSRLQNQASRIQSKIQDSREKIKKQQVKTSCRISIKRFFKNQIAQFCFTKKILKFSKVTKVITLW